MAGSEVGVDHRRCDCLVAQEYLDSLYTNPLHDQSAGKGVAEAVPGEIRYICFLAGFWKPLIGWVYRKDIR